MRLDDSPDDKRSRDQAIALILKRIGIFGGGYVVLGLLAWALGVPPLIVIAVGVITLVLVFTDT